MGLVNTLGNFVSRTSYEDLPEAVIEATKDRLLDFLGGAFFESKGKIVQPLVKVFKSGGRAQASTVIGRKTKLPCPQAAFINSSMAFDIGDIPHTGCLVTAAALAMSEVEAKTGVISGKDLLLAIALGYEVAIRVGRVVGRSAFKRGIDLTGIVGPVGSAIGVGKIMALDEARMANALSIAAGLGAGFLESSKPPRPFVLIEVGRACEAGIIAALLAREGVQGADMMLEKGMFTAFTDSPQLDVITKDLGKDYLMPKTTMKVHGGCGSIHAPIDTAMHIVKEHNLSPGDIEQIKVQTCSGTMDDYVDSEYPETGESARFSNPFGIASSIVFGNTFQDKFTDANLRNKQVQELIRRTTVERSPQLDKESPQRRAVIVEIKTKQGKVFSHRKDFAKGQAEWPMTRSEIVDKFNYMTAKALSQDRKQAIISYVYKLDSKPDLSGLFPLLGAEQK